MTSSFAHNWLREESFKKEKKMTSVPKHFLCPITLQLMQDPVIAKDGHTYERSAITAWLSAHGTSPITRQPLFPVDLTPNRAVAAAIEEFMSSPGIEVGTGALRRATAPPAAEEPPSAHEGPLSVEVFQDDALGFVAHVSVPSKSPDGGSLPVDVICLIDVSGSMGTSATVQDAAGNTESHGLSILDVVKHATATISAMLQPRDRLSIVTFSSRANVVLPLTYMNEAGKESVKTELARLDPSGSTNLWDGLVHAVDLAGNGSGRATAILLLTDGQPTDEPPRGYMPTFDRYLAAKFDDVGSSLPFLINTVGFGYSLNSQLLLQIAERTGGNYVFIPDSGLVGTVFLNLVANIQATAAVSLSLSMTGKQPIRRNLGSIQFGQNRTVPLGKTLGELKLVYRFQGKECFAQASASRLPLDQNERDAIVNALAAFHFSTAFAGGLTQAAALAVRATVDKLPSKTPFITDLLKDLDGQVKMAFEEKFFDKWGKHFVPSIARANGLQQCNNFKDFSVQHFGGELFHQLRDVGEAAFLKLPPPTPSNVHELSRPGGRSSSPVANMTAYYNYSGGCVTADSMVTLISGEQICASSVRKGMALAPFGAAVICVVRVKVDPSGCKLVRFPASHPHLAITEYHPIREPSTGEWAFPVNCPGAVRAVEKGHSFVYTYVLSPSSHALVVGGVEVVSLGHGLTGSSVVEHEYLGTSRILHDLARLSGFKEHGVVAIGGFTRDPKTNRVTGLLETELRQQAPVPPTSVLVRRPVE